MNRPDRVTQSKRSLDELHRFHFQTAPVRGHWVRLCHAWRDACRFHSYPAAVRDALGQMLAVVSMVAHNVKFDGVVALQSLGDGPLSLALAECRNQRFIRGLAQEHDTSSIIARSSFCDLIGNGQLALSLLPTSGETYQGLVELTTPDLASNIENYFANSEQLETRIRISVIDHSNWPSVVGCLLQRLPDQDNATEIEIESNAQEWLRVSGLFDEAREADFAETDVEKFLCQFFEKDLIHLDDGRRIAFGCHCSRERTEETLHTMGARELSNILKAEKELSVKCEFCGASYTFKQKDLALH